LLSPLVQVGGLLLSPLVQVGGLLLSPLVLILSVKSKTCIMRKFLQSHTLKVSVFYTPLVTICTAHWSLYVPPTGHYMYRQFNIHNSAFCPHSVIMCFV